MWYGHQEVEKIRGLNSDSGELTTFLGVRLVRLY